MGNIIVQKLYGNLVLYRNSFDDYSAPTLASLNCVSKFSVLEWSRFGSPQLPSGQGLYSSEESLADTSEKISHALRVKLDSEGLGNALERRVV